VTEESIQAHKVQLLHCICPNFWLAVTEKFRLPIRKE
jgi:hypothetical protein